jgi:hypothetical protein
LYLKATSGKKLYQGKEYDYVFDIEIDEPRCTLKLPFNIADDPYMTAQQFIHKYVCWIYFLKRHLPEIFALQLFSNSEFGDCCWYFFSHEIAEYVIATVGTQ